MTTVHIAKVDGDVLSAHASAAGAGRAIAAEISRRYALNKGEDLRADEERLLAEAVTANGWLILEMNRGHSGRVEGIDTPRLTNIAFQINRRFDIQAKELLA